MCVFELSVARMDSLASAASSLGQTVRTAIIPCVASSIMEGITAKIGTSIASIVLSRVTDKPNPKKKKRRKYKSNTNIFQLTKSLRE